MTLETMGPIKNSTLNLICNLMPGKDHLGKRESNRTVLTYQAAKFTGFGNYVKTMLRCNLQ